MDKYIRKRLSYPNIITAEEINKDPSKYMVVLNFWYFDPFQENERKQYP